MERVEFAGANFCTSSGLLTATGASITYDTTVTLNYSIDGAAYTKTAISGGTTVLLDVNTGLGFVAVGPDQTCWFAWLINAAGTVAVAQGPITNVDGTADVPLVYPQLPNFPSTYVCFAIQRVQTTGASAAFAFGASNWNATGITSVIQNRMVYPSRPPIVATA